MSLTNAIMDLILMGLLVAALWFGVRLDKRLKALRAAHEGFARAVGELDDAAIRAHNSLKELRAHADESQDLLHGRVLAAREVLNKLDAQVSRAERAQRDLDKGMVSYEAMAAVRMAPVSAPQDKRPDIRLTPETSRQPVADPVVRDLARPFARDAVRPAAAAPRRSLLPEQTPPDEREVLDKVQMSELVVANLNEMIRSLNMPRRQPESVEDDLFGKTSKR
ncbi:DUF6468 domain-containing protein [Asticcacaulis sp. EMRT-3]|uniref:DUF6468 domain-containing protein n=1 Tax=Asticcacaulis sp. EMRT-3 TaxID=3040349 RepID=UPI0024AFF820|nr:DUF6468 domain-containing protein [Asticcacaulis sp. EMRT-3]MDI7773802.1 DUF6468 domain-containing protein [Asticcacaulis sp. EMRT-3]